MSRGKKHTKETKKKISEALKGEKHHLWGKHHSEETIRKISEALKGRKLTGLRHEVWKRKLSERMMNNKYYLGKKHSKKTRRKMRESHKGHLAWNKGKFGYTTKWKGQKHTEKTKQKIGKASRGRKLSEETKRKISESHKGEKSYLWKGGISPENHKIRTSLEMKFWKRACLERDKFTCQKTGQNGGKLVIHHINNFADFPELRFAIDNGITLSEKAHNEFHNKYGRKNNTREQLSNFLTSFCK